MNDGVQNWARTFYDATFGALEGKPGEMDARGRLIYTHDGGRLMITKPIDGQPDRACVPLRTFPKRIFRSRPVADP